MCTLEQEDCTKSISTNNSKCLKKCEGIEITSFTEHENAPVEPGSKIFQMSERYNYYKSWYKFPNKFKGKNNCKEVECKEIYAEYGLRPSLQVVEISFDTPTFDRITKDAAVKPVQVLSAIGGTMGLLTGFSIISAVEIVYFVIKFCLKLSRCK